MAFSLEVVVALPICTVVGCSLGEVCGLPIGTVVAFSVEVVFALPMGRVVGFWLAVVCRLSVGIVVGCSHDNLHFFWESEAEQSANLHHSGSEQATLHCLTASWLEQSTATHHSGSSSGRKYIILVNSVGNQRLISNQLEKLKCHKLPEGVLVKK